MASFDDFDNFDLPPLHKEDAELPPLTAESDIPMTLSDIDMTAEGPFNPDMSDVAKTEVINMDNTAVEAAPQTNYNANRRRSFVREKAMDNYRRKVRGEDKNTMDIIYAQKEQEVKKNVCEEGHAHFAAFAFAAASAIMFISTLSFLRLIMFIGNLVVAKFLYNHNNFARWIMVALCYLDLTNCISRVNMFHKESPFLGALFTVLAIIFGLLMLFLIIDPHIREYCRRSATDDEEYKENIDE